MKTFRLLSATLLAACLAAADLPAQDSDVSALRAKAEKGNAIAQYNLGLTYAEGRGVAADPIEAYAWLSLAMENGARGQALNALIITLDISTLNAAKQRLADHRASLSLKSAPAAEPTGPTLNPPAPVAAAVPVVAERNPPSSETMPAGKEIAALTAELARAKENSALTDQLRRERDALLAKFNDLSADRERLQALVTQTELGTSEQSRAAQEKTRLAEIHAADLGRELQTVRAALDAAQQAQQQLNARLNTTEADKVSLEQILNTARTAALESDRQIDALKTQLTAQAEKLPPPAPVFPDLSARVNDLQQQLAASEAQHRAALAAKPSTPAYPDLTGRVHELEAQLAAVKPAAPAYLDLSDRVRALEAVLAETQAALHSEQTKAAAASEAQHRAALAAKPAKPAYPDLSKRVRELETQLAAAATKPAAPDYPDLSEQVKILQLQLAAAAKSVAPTYPDLSDRVRLLEASLSEAQAKIPVASTPDDAAPATDRRDLAKELEETKAKLETSLRGYLLLQNERDELAARVALLNASISTGRDSLASRLAIAESKAELAHDEVERAAQALAALQRSTSQTSRDYASQQALLQQMRGANTVLAQENYQLKAALARDPNAPRVNNTVTPVPVPAIATPAPVAPAASRTHTVAAGDSLSKISLRYYGTANRWREILQANPGTVSPAGVVRVGTTLRIP